MSGEQDMVFGEFAEKINKIRQYNGYKYFSGKNSGLENKAFADLNGPLFADGFKWPFEADEVWLKGQIVIPERIAGIPIAGSKAILAHMSLCSSVLYLNGEKRVDEKWWVNRDVPLSDSLDSNDAFDITIRFKKIDGNTFLCLPQMFIDRVEPIFLKIDGFFKTLKFLARLIESGEIKDKQLITIYANIVSRTPLDLLRDEKAMDFADYITKTASVLQPFSPYLKKYCSYLIGHAHIDMNWLWDWENTLDTARRTFLQVEKFMDKYPEFYFSQGQAALYKAMEDNCPQVFESIKRMVKDGRWEVTASTWVEGDLNIVSGEALIRQSLLAKEYTREKFGVESRVCWCPDTFGHPASYPQILKKCGIDYYYFCRCGKNLPLFSWEGMDGSRVLAFNDPNGYNGVVNADLISRFDRSGEEPNREALSSGGFVNSLKEDKIKKYLFSYGVGDHGGGPTTRDIQNGLTLKAEPAFSEVSFSTTRKFFDDVKRERKDIPVLKGELNYIFEGCYTTHADIKKSNRQGENLLVSAEIFASLASVFGFDYPADRIKQAWENTCFNQFHDILDGSAIHSSYDYSRQLAEESIAGARQTLSEATQYLSSLISFPRKENKAVPVVVFNPLAWLRDDPVEIDLAELGPDYTAVEDISGKEIPAQVFGERLFFQAHAVPSLGYKTYFLRRKPTPPAAIPPEKSAAKAETIFENDRYLLEIDLTTGGIKRLFNKKQKKELIDGFHQGNIFRLYTEQEHDMSAWSIGRIDSVKNLLKNTKIIRTVKGPVMDIIETECIFGKSRISQEIIFFKAQDKIEFRTRLSWYETGTPETGIPLLRVSFPLGIISAKAVYEIPFGAIERPNNGQEAPALKWLDYSQGKFGIALLNNAKYGHNVQGNKVELTLIRSPYFPDLNPDSGEHTFSYCLCPHEGNWQDADIVKRGYELNMPLIPVVIDKLNTGCDDKILPPEKAFVKAGAKNIIISCLKKAEDGKGLILHAYESQGRVSKGRLDFGLDINIAAETDLIEKTLSSVGLAENKIEYEFAKWEIKAYRLVPGEKG